MQRNVQDLIPVIHTSYVCVSEINFVVCSKLFLINEGFVYIPSGRILEREIVAQRKLT